MYENPTFDFHNQNINHDKNKETKDQKRLLTTRSLDGVGEGVRGEGGGEEIPFPRMGWWSERACEQGPCAESSVCGLAGMGRCVSRHTRRAGTLGGLHWASEPSSYAVVPFHRPAAIFPVLCSTTFPSSWRISPLNLTSFQHFCWANYIKMDVAGTLYGLFIVILLVSHTYK